MHKESITVQIDAPLDVAIRLISEKQDPVFAGYLL